MSATNHTGVDRRALLCAAGAVPLWLDGIARGAWAATGGDRTLVVLELVGGNDGLNTVIPIDDARYAARRPKLSVVRRGAHPVGAGLALHPALPGLHRLVRDGRATIATAVGYPGPDRSHFRSREIWHVADPAHQRIAAGATGWLGRAADLLAAQTGGVPAAAIGGLEVPLLLRAQRAVVPSLQRVEDFQWLAATGDGPVAAGAPVRRLVAADPGGGDLREFAAARARRAVQLADDLSAALERWRPAVDYPAGQLGSALQLTARLVAAGFGTRLLHVPFGGFDTHARQLPTHAGLLQQLDAAVTAFAADLAAQGCLDRVVVLVHSEFGRRVAENASQGTDHGAAGPVFVLLGGSRGGVLGAAPDLDALDDGDLVATLDFRRVYADLLTWLGLDAKAVLGGHYPAAGLWA